MQLATLQRARGVYARTAPTKNSTRPVAVCLFLFCLLLGRVRTQPLNDRSYLCLHGFGVSGEIVICVFVLRQYVHARVCA